MISTFRRRASSACATYQLVVGVPAPGLVRVRPVAVPAGSHCLAYHCSNRQLVENTASARGTARTHRSQGDAAPVLRPGRLAVGLAQIRPPVPGATRRDAPDSYWPEATIRRAKAWSRLPQETTRGGWVEGGGNDDDDGDGLAERGSSAPHMWLGSFVVVVVVIGAGIGDTRVRCAVA